MALPVAPASGQAASGQAGGGSLLGTQAPPVPPAGVPPPANPAPPSEPKAAKPQPRPKPKPKSKPAAPARHPAKPAVPVVRAKPPLHPRKPPAKAPAAPAAAAAAPAAPSPPSVQEPAVAAPPPEPGKGSVTGLPLPRFAALRSDEVNLRAGPGTRYPIEWVYHRRDLPVQIEREFEVWRLVSDPDGIKGWVHQATLTGRRSLVVRGTEATLRSEPRDDAQPVARLMPGVVGRLQACAAGADWCQVRIAAYRGYLRRDAFWGATPGEAVN